MSLNNKGFTLIQVMVVGAITFTVLWASTQATLLFVRSMIAVEKSSEAMGESQELLNQVRRSSQNLTRKRLNEATTYYRRSDGSLSAVGTFVPVASYTADSGTWLTQGSNHPQIGKVRSSLPGALQTQYPYRLDSFNLEEHSVVSDGSVTRKHTKRILVARCGSFSDYLSLTNLQGSPAVTALYVMETLKLRPFIKFDNQGQANISCCPTNLPNCSGSMYQYFFRGYSIAFDQNQRVISVEEFPKSVAGNPVVGGGFGIYFNSATSNSMQLLTFTIANRCRSLTMTKPPAICGASTSLQEFMNGAANVPGLLKIDTRSFTTTISNEIGSTGVISL